MDGLSFELPAPAKLNLFLNITGRQPDGYHELQTVFQLIDWCDTVRFAPAEEVEVRCPGLDLAQEENLAYKAAVLLRRETGCKRGATIEIAKQIPAGGGLGGGSSDAATTLVGLDLLWNLGLAGDRLAALGAQLGADVPVFLYGRSAWAEGIGEKLQAVDLPKKFFVVLHPGCHVSTAGIFADADLTRNGTPITIAHFLRQGSENVCEPVVRRLYPSVDAACRWLARWGIARMTGTGSCVFLATDSEHDAREIQKAVPREWTAFVARGIDKSPLYDAISRVNR